MKWLKYQHKFSSGRHPWEWRPLGEHINGEIVDDVVRELASEYNYSDKYGGIDYEVLDVAPSWVITREAIRAQDRADSAVRTNRMWQSYVQDIAMGGAVFVCKQCENAEHPKDGRRHSDTTVKPCPTCGREVIAATLAFWLMPDDKPAVKLLGSLVEKGARTLKLRHNTRFRWPLKGKAEEEAFNRLVKLGLAGGSSYQNVHEIHATKSGEAEWTKHKEHK